MRLRRRQFQHLAVSALALPAASKVGAQTYPAQPVRLMVGFASGQAIDILARRVGGLGGCIAEIVSTHSPRHLVRIGFEDTWGESAPNDFLLDKHGLSAARVAARVLAEMGQ